MPHVDKATLLAGLSPPLDQTLVEQSLDEFVSQERRFVLRDWEPATLDGGQFAEAAARIVYHQDSGTLTHKKGVDACLKYVEEPHGNNTHLYPDRKSALHTAKVIRTIYKFRSDRGAVHISPDYSANHIDSKLLIECVRWVLSEMLRIFWQRDDQTIATAIREIVEYDVPVIGDYEGTLLVQRVDCTAEEETLILLHHAGEAGLSRRELGKYVRKAPSQITNAVKTLASPKRREITQLANGNYRLTALGIRRVLEELGDKLTT